MKEVFNLYFDLLMNPFEYNDSVASKVIEAKNDENIYVLREIEENSEKNLGEELEVLETKEAIAVSWIFVILGALLELWMISLFYKYAQQNDLFFIRELGQAGLGKSQMTGIFTLLNIVLFPLFILVKIKLWTFVLKGMHKLFKETKGDENLMEQIVINALPCHAFLIIPFMGGILRTGAFFIYLYAGITRRLRFSFWQSVLTLMAPVFFFILMISLLAVLVALIVNDLRYAAI